MIVEFHLVESGVAESLTVEARGSLIPACLYMVVGRPPEVPACEPRGGLLSLL